MTDAMSDELKGSVAQAEDLLDSPMSDEPGTKERLKARAREARDRLNGILHDLGARAEGAEQVLKDQYGRAEASVKQGLDHTEVKIKEHPFTAVGIAAGVGLVIGLLINRGR
jgi:ElaB/YqjD/DUF883 family membrane-anchored ribosome-binding protein